MPSAIFIWKMHLAFSDWKCLGIIINISNLKHTVQYPTTFRHIYSIILWYRAWMAQICPREQARVKISIVICTYFPNTVGTSVWKTHSYYHNDIKNGTNSSVSCYIEAHILHNCFIQLSAWTNIFWREKRIKWLRHYTCIFKQNMTRDFFIWKMPVAFLVSKLCAYFHWLSSNYRMIPAVLNFLEYENLWFCWYSCLWNWLISPVQGIISVHISASIGFICIFSISFDLCQVFTTSPHISDSLLPSTSLRNILLTFHTGFSLLSFHFLFYPISFRHVYSCKQCKSNSSPQLRQGNAVSHVMQSTELQERFLTLPVDV